ncbi:MAG: amidohydrolase family protein, partial [Anaerolineaceae bacterium]|nr:amidohydrolase family protein [Anaerolineaceae bacterium]
MKIYHGDIIYSESREKLKVFEDSYLAVENGRVEGIYPEIPGKFAGAEVIDHGRGLIIPAFSDLHVHASQYIQRGIGMDLLLNDWLNTYTFPQESNFADPEYAEPIYEAYVNDMIRNGTFHASIFTTIHRGSADILFRKLEENGLWALVGKVNMDFQSPSYLCETVGESLRETEIFLEEHSGNGR